MGMARKGFWFSISSYVVLVLGLIQIFILSRALGPEGVGQLSIFRQVFVVATQLAALGLPTAMVHRVRNRSITPGEAMAPVLLITVGLSLLTAIGLVLSIMFGQSFFGPLEALALIAAFVWVPSVMMRAVLYNHQLSQLDVRAMVLQEVLPQVVLCAWYALAWKLIGIDVSFAVTSETVVVGVFSAMLAVLLSRPWRLLHGLTRAQWLNFRFIRDILPHGILMNSGSLLLLFNGLVSLVVLKAFTEDFAQVGYFSRGLRLATVAAIAIRSLQRLLYSNWSGMEGEKRRRSVERSINFIFMVMLVVGGVTVLMARPLTVLLFGGDFLPAANVTRITIAGVAAFLVVRLLQALFNADGRSHLNIWVLGAGVTTNFAAAMLLAPRWQANGAAAAVLIGYLVMVAVSVSIGRSQYQLSCRRMFIPDPSLIARVAKQLWQRSTPRESKGHPDSQ